MIAVVVLDLEKGNEMARGNTKTRGWDPITSRNLNYLNQQPNPIPHINSYKQINI